MTHPPQTGFGSWAALGEEPLPPGMDWPGTGLPVAFLGGLDLQREEWQTGRTWRVQLNTFYLPYHRTGSTVISGNQTWKESKFLSYTYTGIPPSSEVLWWITAGCNDIVVTISAILCISSLPTPYFVLEFSVKPLRYNMHIKCCTYYSYIAQWDKWNRHKAAILNHQAQRTLWKSRGWKNTGVGNGEDCWEMLFSGHDLAAALWTHSSYIYIY